MSTEVKVLVLNQKYPNLSSFEGVGMEKKKKGALVNHLYYIFASAVGEI